MNSPRPSTAVRLIRAFLAVGFLFGSIALLVVFAWTRPLPDLAENAGAEQPVAIFRVRSVQVPRQWMGYGIVRASDSADVPARVGGVVLEVNRSIREGVAVEVGTFLLQLDDQDFRRAQQAAEQQLAAIDAQMQSLGVEEAALRDRVRLAQEEIDLVRADEQRVREAVQSGAAAQRELDRARQGVITVERAFLQLREAGDQVVPRRAALLAQNEMQSAMRDTAMKNVERCRITSPIAGSVQRFDLEVGENVVPGQVVARIVDPRRLEIPIRLPSSARGFVAIDDPVQLETVGQVPRRVSTKIARIEPEGNALERTMVVHVDVPQVGDAVGLAPGEFVEAAVDAADSKSYSVVPRRSVRSDRVMAVRDGKLVGTPVIVSHSFVGPLAGSGVSDTEWVVLQEPLPDGLVISIEGGRSVAPGTRVRPIEAGTAAAAASEPARSTVGGEAEAR
jgi:multidrug resistance efflux pump